ncbi:MAG: 50S ribosomal protein L10 [Ignavibacteriae bacterium]|nr:MAG: 50S ribosomal protein L10 [Ignavibacteriota bacterium]
MNKNQKIESVAQIKSYIEKATAIYFVDYSGVNVEDINKLRRGFLKEDVSYKVFKNTLIKRAFDEVGGYENLEPLLIGMTGIAFAGENFVKPAKIIKNYFKEHKKFVFKGGFIESQFYDADKLDVLASMPTKEEVMASIVGSIASPASGIVGSINAVMRDLVNVVDQIGKQKAA